MTINSYHELIVGEFVAPFGNEDCFDTIKNEAVKSLAVKEKRGFN